MSRCTRRAIAILAVGGLALAACGGDDDEGATPAPTSSDAPDTTTPAAPTTPPDTDAPTASSTPTTAAPYRDPSYGESPPDTTAAPDANEPASGALVALGETSLGAVLVAADGLTLYLFTPDAEGVPTCVGPCAGTWPPYLVDGGAELTAGDGVDASLLTTVDHPDGGTMLAYAGWPLYYYAADQAPGDVAGQGVNSVWWVVDAAGAPITD